MNNMDKIEKIGYNEVVKKFKAFEKSIIKNKFESPKVILPNGEIFELAGSSRNVSPAELGKDLTGAYIIHNHPESMHDFGFSKDDFSFFIANKLRLLRAVDEKYIHELITDLFEMEFEDIDINELVKLDKEKVAEKLQKQEALNRNLKYRRLKHDY